MQQGKIIMVMPCWRKENCGAAKSCLEKKKKRKIAIRDPLKKTETRESPVLFEVENAYSVECVDNLRKSDDCNVPTASLSIHVVAKLTEEFIFLLSPHLQSSSLFYFFKCVQAHVSNRSVVKMKNMS